MRWYVGTAGEDAPRIYCPDVRDTRHKGRQDKLESLCYTSHFGLPMESTGRPSMVLSLGIATLIVLVRKLRFAPFHALEQTVAK